MPAQSANQNWLPGENLTVVSVKPLSLVSNVWTAGDAVSLEAFIKSLEDSEDIDTEDIRPVTSPLKNEVPISWGEGLRLQVLAISDDLNSLTNLWRTTPSRRFQIDWTAGEEVSSGRYTAKSRRGGVSSHGENTIDFTFGPMDDGTHGAAALPSNVDYGPAGP